MSAVFIKITAGIVVSVNICIIKQGITMKYQVSFYHRFPDRTVGVRVRIAGVMRTSIKWTPDTK